MRKYKDRRAAYLLLTLPLLVAVLAGGYQPQPADTPSAIEQVHVVQEPTQQATAQALYPQDELLHDSARGDYADGNMQLVVPRMGVSCDVLDGVDPQTLERGVGLYDNAQLPSWGNPNVSIAGHRDVHGSPFMEIDKLVTGDKLYLVLDDMVFTYDWAETITVQSNDWSVIHCTDYSRITLTSCDPVGTTLHRIIAIGKLAAVEPYTASFTFV